jgi:urease accessory protein
MMNGFIQDGWKGFLSFSFVDNGKRTVVKDKKHFGPLVLQRPYYQEFNRPSVLVIHPPGGIVGGDVLELNVHLKDNSKGLVSTPAATKFYRSTGRLAKQIQSIEMDSDCELEWLPQETLFFDEAVVENNLSFHLKDANSKLIAWDIVGLGRPARGEGFENGILNQSLELMIDDSLVFVDRLKIDKESLILNSKAGLDGFMLSATALFYCDEFKVMKGLKESLQNQEWTLPVGITQMDGLVVLRVLGQELDEVKGVLYEAWKIARPIVLGVPVIKPRIWNT